MKHTNLIASIIGVLAFAHPGTLRATDYSTVIGNSVVTWTNASWTPSGIPGVGDNITDISSDSATQRGFYLNGDHEVQNLTRVGSSGTGTLQIFNYSSATNTTQTLTITDTLTVQRSLGFRSQNNTQGRLVVDVKDIIIDATNVGTTLTISESTNYPRVTLDVSGSTTFKNGNSRFVMERYATSETIVNLGNVFFENTLSGGSPGLEINAGTLKATSLSSSTNGSVGVIRTASGYTNVAKLLIDGGSGTNTTAFKAIISDYGDGRLTVEKTGNTIQILNSTNGSSYRGGTIISGGVLAAHSTNLSVSSMGFGAVTVKTNGTLAGSGTIVLKDGNYTTVEAGGTIAPSAHGEGGFSSLRMNNYFNYTNVSHQLLDMEAGSSFTFKLDDSGNNDKILFGYYVAGDVVFGGDIAVNITGTLSTNVVYQLFHFSSGGTESPSPINSGITNGLIGGTGFGGYIPTFHYDEAGYGGTGVISMTVIPEPTTTLLLMASLLGTLVFWQRNLRKKRP